MLMLKCKDCGEVFPGVYIAEDKYNKEFVSTVTNQPLLQTCSRKHQNEYSNDDYMDFS